MLIKTLSSHHRKVRLPRTLLDQTTNHHFQSTVISACLYSIISTSNVLWSVRSRQGNLEHTIFHSQTATKYRFSSIQLFFHSVHNCLHFTAGIYSKCKFPLSRPFLYPVPFHNISLAFSLHMAGHEPAPAAWTAINTTNTVKQTNTINMDIAIMNTYNEELSALETDSRNQ